MSTTIQYIAIFVFVIISQISCEHGFKPSITCYTRYDHEETKTPRSEGVVSYSYHQSETTQYTTPDNELCSKVGCACFSYKAICSHLSPGTNHFSTCNEADRQNQVMKWHRGISSHEKCEQMRRSPQTYPDLTCCYTDRCNDQPGKITHVVDSQALMQRIDSYPYQAPQPMYAGQGPAPRYDNPRQYPTAAPRYNNPEQYPTASPRYNNPGQYPTAAPRYNNPGQYSTNTTAWYEKYRKGHGSDGNLPPYNSLSFNFPLNWMIFLALSFCLLIIV